MKIIMIARICIKLQALKLVLLGEPVKTIFNSCMLLALLHKGGQYCFPCFTSGETKAQNNAYHYPTG